VAVRQRISTATPILYELASYFGKISAVMDF
jgi:hypothetical protein